MDDFKSNNEQEEIQQASQKREKEHLSNDKPSDNAHNHGPNDLRNPTMRRHQTQPQQEHSNNKKWAKQQKKSKNLLEGRQQEMQQLQ